MEDRDIVAGASGRTFRITDDANGTQIEHLSEDGSGYLWYPGNHQIVPSRWKVEKRQLCFLYPTNSVDMTGQYGGKWECRSGGWWLNFRAAESVAGDPFGLSKNADVPFLTKKYLIFFDVTPAPTLAQLLEVKRTGRCRLPICAHQTP